MSSFAGLQTAFLGVTAQRRALDVVGQNIADVNTPGYTRQRVEMSPVPSRGGIGLFTQQQVAPGRGVSVDAISRLGDVHLDNRVRSTAAASGFASVRAAALAALETSLREPGETGLSARLDAFWASWEDLANRPGDPAAEAVVLEGATAVVSAITAGYQEVVDQWARGRSALDGLVSDLNTAAAQVADLNARIRSTAAAGGSVNELVDQRAAVAATLAALGGGEVRNRDDGTVDVLIGGNPIVQGTSVNRLVVTGAARVQDAAADPVQVEWAHRPGTPAGVGDGEIAAHVSLLAPAQPAGTGGVLAEAAATYDALAADLAAAVNAVHTTGTTTSGAPAGDVFGFTPGVSAAAGLRVVVTAGGLATAAPGAGPLDGSVADAIAAIGRGAGSPGAVWAAFVTTTGAAARTANDRADLAALSARTAVDLQLGTAGVDLDEETMNLLTYQRAYEGAARVMTVMDEMLDVLINRTGVVGR